MNPINQLNLYGLDNFFNDLKFLYDHNKLPNKILLSGQKGSGKFTLSLHLINYILSKNEDYPYDTENFKVNENNKSYKLIKNQSSPNLYLIDVINEKKVIEINQIRELISFCNKSSLNDKPRFILIDNLELMNLNSNNALLRTLEEPNDNIYFILINNSCQILPTIKSRCLDFRIYLSQKKYFEIFNLIIKKDINNLFNNNLISHYFSTGDLVNLYNFSIENNIDLLNKNLEEFLLEIIDKNYYKKDILDISLIYSFIQMYYLKKTKISKNYEIYSKFIKTIKETKSFNLDLESVFIKFRQQLAND